MAIHESKKQSDLEKRLKLLRQQVYGKTESHSFQTSDIKKSDNYSITADITYLYQDLFKILILSSAAIAVQLLLFILTKNHILNINIS